MSAWVLEIMADGLLPSGLETVHAATHAGDDEHARAGSFEVHSGGDRW
jgi:hypothetical protein